MDNIRKILSVAGSDSSGGAGIQADIKTISAFGHYAMTAITAITAQNTLGVSLLQSVSPEIMAAQLDSVLTDLFPDSVKIGMLMNYENVKITAEKLKHYGAKNIVADTVIMSTSGRQLLDDEGLSAFVDFLLPIADVITPNIPEAQRLCKIKIREITDMEKAAKMLSDFTNAAILVKGGHLEGDECCDVLLHNNKFSYYINSKINNNNTHGTGCTLSSAIACCLAENLSAEDAVDNAKKYITKVISADFDIGMGNGPLWHF